MFVYKLARVSDLNWFCGDEQFSSSKGMDCMRICCLFPLCNL